jgi:hypothetical protein
LLAWSESGQFSGANGCVMSFTNCACFDERSWFGQADEVEHILPVQQIVLILTNDVVEFLDECNAEIVPGLSGFLRPAEVITHAIELVEKGLGALMIKPREVGKE